MWIITTAGFFSIVKKQYRPTDPEFQVRARVYQDLVNINTLMNTNHQIITTSTSDYPHRILLNSQQLLELFLILASTINYKNFKDELYRYEGQRNRLLPYHDVWHTLQNI